MRQTLVNHKKRVMKKVLIFICLVLFTAVNSQSLEINTISGGVEIVRTSTNDTLQYSDGASLYAMIDNNNSLRIYQKLGGRVFSPYLFTDVEVDGVAFTDKKTMLKAINEIPAFMVPGLSGSAVDSGEVIGNFLYLFSSSDTAIIDVTSLKEDSLWQVSSGKVVNVDTTNQFRFEYGHYGLVNDTFAYNPFAKVPFSGSFYKDDSLIVLNGINDFSAFPGGGGPQNIITWIKDTIEHELYSGDAGAFLTSARTNGMGTRLRTAGIESSVNTHGLSTIRLYTSYTSTTGEENAEYIDIEDGWTHNLRAGEWKIVNYQANSAEFKYNSNGVVLPTFTSEPTGESGAVYYNGSTTEFRAYNGSGFQTISTYGEGAGSPVGSVTPDHKGIIYYDTSNAHLFISVGTTSSDWIKIN